MGFMIVIRIREKGDQYICWENGRDRSASWLFLKGRDLTIRRLTKCVPLTHKEENQSE